MIKFIIDSASDISKDEAESLGVIMVPMTVTIGGEDFLDGVDLLPHRFYEKMIENTQLPKTGAVNQYRWEEAIRNNLGDNDQIIIITMSSKLSSTYDGAKNAAKNFKQNVYVVDSLNVAIGERILLEYALSLSDKAYSAQEIVEKLNEKKKKINLIAVISTLEYLKKGGRVSPTVALAGTILSIKPVVAIVEGKVKVIGKAMGSKKGNNLLNKFIEDKGGINFNMPFATTWSGLDKSLLNKYISDSSYIWENYTQNVPSHILGGTIGTHIGPGAVGVAFFAN